MSRSLDYSTRARANLLAIQSFIALDNATAAARVIEHITESADGLIDFPMTGKPWLRAGTRKLVLTKFPYSIIYKLTTAKVIVLAVAHQSRRHA